MHFPSKFHYLEAWARHEQFRYIELKSKWNRKKFFSLNLNFAYIRPSFSCEITEIGWNDVVTHSSKKKKSFGTYIHSMMVIWAKMPNVALPLTFNLELNFIPKWRLYLWMCQIEFFILLVGRFGWWLKWNAQKHLPNFNGDLSRRMEKRDRVTRTVMDGDILIIIFWTSF